MEGKEPVEGEPLKTPEMGEWSLWRSEQVGRGSIYLQENGGIFHNDGGGEDGCGCSGGGSRGVVIRDGPCLIFSSSQKMLPLLMAFHHLSPQKDQRFKVPA